VSSSKKSSYDPTPTNTKNSYQSNKDTSGINTADLSQTWSFSSVNDEASETDSISCNCKNFTSWDGLNMRPSNRYDIVLEMLKAQIHCGADPKNLCTHGNRTALMFSVLAGDLSFTKELVQLGVDLNQSSHLGETALSLALEGQNEDIVNYLRLQGAVDKVAE